MFDFPTPKALLKVEEKRPEFFLENFLPLPKGAITMLSAQGGSGKSFLSIQLAIRLVNQNKNTKALLWLSEDPAWLSKHRAEEILNKIEEVGSDLKDIDIIDEMPQHLNFTNYNKYKELFTPYDLIVLDPLIAFYGGEENNNTQARLFMNLLNKIARDNIQSFLILHHSTKASKEMESRSRGAGAFVDAVRLSYEIKSVETDPNLKEILVIKDNFGVKQIIGEKKEIIVLPYKIIEEVQNNQNIIIMEDEEIETDEEKRKIANMQKKGFTFDE